jgi:hypothetical protein
MPKRITRKQAERLIRERFGEWEGEYIPYLCGSIMPTHLQDKWWFAWKEMDTGGHALCFRYMRERDRRDPIIGFLRLLTIHLWIRHDFE